jgi:ABC-type nitrate/sulfonate/bicarbonate transport system ATPase subunit
MSKLELRNVTQSYREGGQRLLAVRDVNFAIAPGEFVTLIGPSGSGKTTLLQVIAGLLQPDRGKVLIDDEVATRRLGRVAYMPQRDALLPWRTVMDNVTIGPEIRGDEPRRRIAPTEIPNGDKPKDEEEQQSPTPWFVLNKARYHAKERARELIPLFGLEGFEDAFPAQLSGGMRQRAAFLRTFLAGQEILLLDEPFGALDALTRRDLQNWLLDIWQHFDYTIVFVTHDVEEAIYLSDRVLALSPRPGHIIEEIDIPFERPRQHTVEKFSPEITRLERQLFQSLKG